MPAIAPIIPGFPGMRVAVGNVPRRVFLSTDLMYMPGGRIIDGSKSRDPGNTGDTDRLRPGLLMGKITSSGKYAPSILGVTTNAEAQGSTALETSAATATEIVRRIGATGTLKIIGPPTASGTVRSITATYSGVDTSTGAITITAMNVDEVQTLNIGGTVSGGSFKIGFTLANGELVWTDTIAHDATFSTVITNINTAVNNLLGSSEVVATGSGYTAIALTFSGTNYDDGSWPLVALDVAALTGASTATVTRTTTGVDGRFVAGSLICPTDGSETPKTIIPDDQPVAVTDASGTSLDVAYSRFPIGGHVDASQIINYPSDSSLKTWLKAQLNATATGLFSFDDAY